jgi:hypothetical protein
LVKLYGQQVFVHENGMDYYGKRHTKATTRTKGVVQVVFKHIKGSKDMAYEKWLLEIVAKHFEISLVEAKTSLDFWYATEQGKQELLTLLKRYGVDPKEIKKLNLR